VSRRFCALHSVTRDIRVIRGRMLGELVDQALPRASL
jgi:hypothetical protein